VCNVQISTRKRTNDCVDVEDVDTGQYIMYQSSNPSDQQYPAPGREIACRHYSIHAGFIDRGVHSYSVLRDGSGVVSVTNRVMLRVGTTN
jgi:hypothetical protein